MGCKASKAPQQLTPFDTGFARTQNKEFNAFFDRAINLLDKAEMIRRRFVSSGQKCFEQAGTSGILVNKYVETIRILLWAISAGYQGQILRSGIKIVQGSPFISSNMNGLCAETQELYHSVRGYLDIVVDGSEVLKVIVDGLTGMSTELTVIQQDWLDPKDFSEGAVAFRDNTRKFNMELLKTKALFKVVSTEKRTIEKTVPRVQQLATKADVIGTSAYNQKLIKPLEIFHRFTTIQKKRNTKGVNMFDMGPENIEEDHGLDSVNQNATTSELIVNKNVSFESPVRANKSNIMVQDQSQNGSPYKLHNANPQQKVKLGQGGLGEPLTYPTANKIQVNAPEMKDLVVKQPMTEMGGTQFPLYKFSSPTKDALRPNNTAMITKSPLEQGLKSTIPIAKVSGDQQQPQQSIIKPQIVHNFSDIDAIISQATRSIPVNFGQVGQAMQGQQQNNGNNMINNIRDKAWGDMNVNDDEGNINTPAENSTHIKYFSERRNYYMVHLKS